MIDYILEYIDYKIIIDDEFQLFNRLMVYSIFIVWGGVRFKIINIVKFEELLIYIF